MQVHWTLVVLKFSLGTAVLRERGIRCVNEMCSEVAGRGVCKDTWRPMGTSGHVSRSSFLDASFRMRRLGQ